MIVATITLPIQSTVSRNDHIGVASTELMPRRFRVDVFRRMVRKMILNLFDATPEDSETTDHGPLGNAHAARVEVDYPYQIEQWVIEMGTDHPEIIRAEYEDLRRKWTRDSPTTFVEVPW